MTIVFWIIGIVVAIYLLLVIPAGIAVWNNKRKFKTSPYRHAIEKIISDFKLDILSWKKDRIENLVKQSHREIVTNEGEEFSVVIEAKKKTKDLYRVLISVGKFKLITIGHVETFVVKIE